MSIYTRFGLAALALALGAPFAPARGDDDPVPLPGPVVFDARSAKTLKDLSIREGVQFGTFRDPTLGKGQNWIEYSVKPITLPGGATENFLSVYYNVTKPETYNGVWFKLGDANWAKYSRGEVVFRLRQLEPQNAIQIFDANDKLLKDTACTGTFKIELKVSNAKGEVASFGLRHLVSRDESAQQQKLGFFDVRVPINQFGFDEKQLARASELVLVFEEKAVRPHVRGNMGIQAIVVLPEKGKVIDIDKIQKDNDKLPKDKK
jgi:hypothetical protein